VTISQLCTRALVELNAASAGQPVQPEVLALALETLNMILDQINASEQKLYADLFSTFAITPNLQPHTIGPSGTWNYPIARPAMIPQAAIILNTGAAPYPRVALTPLTAQEWQALTVPGLATSLPNRYYYDPTIPNGSFYFYSVADTAYQVQLLTRQLLSQVVAGTTFQQPPGYWYALMLMLAKALKSPLRKPWSQEQETLLTQACLLAFGQNSLDLVLATVDAGMPRSGGVGARQDFNWATGQIV
jgi:hypothetical protein